MTVRSRDAEALRGGGLAARFIAGGGDQHLVAAVTAGDGRLVTASAALTYRAEHHRQSPAQVIREPVARCPPGVGSKLPGRSPRHLPMVRPALRTR